MSVVRRYFILASDGSFARFPSARFDRVVFCEPRELVPELKGQRVRYAEFAVRLNQRKPVRIQHASFGYLLFDQRGRFDSTEWEEAGRLRIESWRLPRLPQQTTILDAREQFADRCIDREHHWQPSDELRARLIAAALKAN